MSPFLPLPRAVAEPLHEEHDDTLHIRRSLRSQPQPQPNGIRNSAVQKPRTYPSWLARRDIVKVEEEAEREEQNDRVAAGSASRSTSLSVRRARMRPRSSLLPEPWKKRPSTRKRPTPFITSTSSDEGYDEFEEETQAGPGHLNGDARETVAEIHQSSMAETGEAHRRGRRSRRGRRRQ